MIRAISISLFLIIMSAPLFAGWLFGPNERDKDNVKVLLSGGVCPTGTYSFEIKNGSKYIVNEVRFGVTGQIPGRSTLYDLNFGYNESGHRSFVSDDILAPFTGTTGCWKLNQQNWPKGARLNFTVEVRSVDFQVDGGRETVGTDY